jgi:SPP1 family predicted phage head-tail adaptor
MQAGKLRKTIVFQKRDPVTDTHGGQVTTWSDVAQVRAEVMPLTGREALAAQSFQGELTHQITVRYSAFLAEPLEVAKMRILYGTRVFNIRSAINQEETNRMVILLVTEGLNDG